MRSGNSSPTEAGGDRVEPGLDRGSGHAPDGRSERSRVGSAADRHDVVPSRLCDFVRHYSADIVSDWSGRMRALSPAGGLSTATLIDHVPQILTRIADIVESTHTGHDVSLDDLPEMHALDRLDRGFDLDHIVVEYSLLRRVILDRWETAAVVACRRTRRVARGPGLLRRRTRALWCAADA